MGGTGTPADPVTCKTTPAMEPLEEAKAKAASKAEAKKAALLPLLNRYRQLPPSAQKIDTPGQLADRLQAGSRSLAKKAAHCIDLLVGCQGIPACQCHNDCTTGAGANDYGDGHGGHAYDDDTDGYDGECEDEFNDAAAATTMEIFFF